MLTYLILFEHLIYEANYFFDSCARSCHDSEVGVGGAFESFSTWMPYLGVGLNMGLEKFVVKLMLLCNHKMKFLLSDQSERGKVQHRVCFPE